MQEQLIISRLHSITSAPLQKAIVAFFFSIFAPAAPAVIGLFVLIGIDLIVGVIRAIKENRFSSARLRTGVSKFLLYPVTIMAVRLGEQQLLYAFGKDIDYVTSFLILYLAITELISVLETLSILGVPIPSPILDFFKKQTDIKNKMLVRP